jgi:hypothetical protein
MVLIGKIDTKKKILKTLHITDEVKYKEHHPLTEVEVIDQGERTIFPDFLANC